MPYVLERDDIRFDEMCSHCYGTGKTTHSKDFKETYRQERECPSCNGVGYTLTNFGVEVLDMLKRFTNIKEKKEDA